MRFYPYICTQKKINNNNNRRKCILKFSRGFFRDQYKLDENLLSHELISTNPNCQK